MDFDLTSDQVALSSSVRDFLTKEYPREVMRRIADSDVGFDRDLWQKVGGLGWAGLIIPEAYGGAGLGWFEASLLFEQTGRSLFIAPLLPAFLCAAALMHAGTDEQKQRFLPSIAEGSIIAVLAWEELFVVDGCIADQLYVVRDDHMVIVEAKDSQVERLQVVDPTRRQAKVKVGHPAADDNVLRGDGLLHRVRDIACLLIAAEQSGITRAVMEMSIDYAKTRRQFDKPIGAYQAVSHKIVDMYTGAEHATSLVYHAAWAADHSPQEAGLSAGRARAWADQAACDATASAIQVHGGIGFTWEHDLHLYYKRARSNRVLLSEPGPLWQRISRSAHG